MTPRCPEHCDEITVMQAPSRRLAKLFPEPGVEAIGYDETKLFNARTTPLAGLHDVHDLVAGLMGQTDAMLVRGELIAGGSAARIRRLVSPDKESGDAATLRDVPRRWLALDCDGIERPEHVEPHDLEGCFDVVLERLPSPFQTAGCIVQATASHGIKQGIRLRLWWWCDRPMGGAELKRWLGAIPGIDRSVFNPAQPIYVAAPVFGSGVRDPLPRRIWECPGLPWVLCPTMEELAPPPAKPTPPPDKIATGTNADAYARAALIGAADAILAAGVGNRHSTIISEARSLARLVKAGVLPERDLRAVVARAAEHVGKSDAREVASIITWALANPSNATVPEKRHAA